MKLKTFFEKIIKDLSISKITNFIFYLYIVFCLISIGYLTGFSEGLTFSYSHSDDLNSNAILSIPIDDKITTIYTYKGEVLENISEKDLTVKQSDILKLKLELLTILFIIYGIMSYLMKLFNITMKDSYNSIILDLKNVFKRFKK